MTSGKLTVVFHVVEDLHVLLDVLHELIDEVAVRFLEILGDDIGLDPGRVCKGPLVGLIVHLAMLLLGEELLA